MRFLKQCLQALPSPPLSLPDPARRPPAFLIVHTDREPGTGYRGFQGSFFWYIVLLRPGDRKARRFSHLDH